MDQIDHTQHHGNFDEQTIEENTKEFAQNDASGHENSTSKQFFNVQKKAIPEPNTPRKLRSNRVNWEILTSNKGKNKKKSKTIKVN